MLPSLIWQPFFYNLGPTGARIYFMLAFGCELLVIICEAYIAATRYLTFIRSSLSTNYWEIRKINQWLLVMVVISAAYASVYFLSDFVTSLDAEKTSARFLFSKSSLDWVTVSIFVPFIVATGAFLSLLVRIANHISYRAGGYDLIPYTVYFLLTRVGQGKCLSLLEKESHRIYASDDDY
ncbi:unnamed protein product [Cylicocyclus nassatus]|uniref:Uncharacterized protein n=1 Tax=Cylicocyclus nassatus TaxID=53992 RepID=A0AA36HDT7_CYLNA|nr:unnamed protein product [Cylicocyclus nassatus]